MRETARRPTIRDVATLAKVGTKTVSRVLNGEPNVSDPTKARVLDAVAALDYQPDLQAGNLRRAGQRTNTIGLLLSDVGNPFAATIHRAIADAAALRGVAVLAASLDENPEREQLAVAAFLRRRVDAIILTTIRSSQAYLVSVLGRGTPVVFIDRSPNGLDADTVTSANTDGAARATRHLIANGHRRIAFLGGMAAIRTTQQRKQGFFDELGRAGIPTGDAVVVEDVANEVEAMQAVADMMTREARPTAILSAQNMITVGAVRQLHQAGLQDTLAIVGFDDVELGDLLTPGLTVVRQNPAEIGRLAAERVFARLDGEDEPAMTVVVPVELVQRGSGEIPPSGG